MRAIGRPSSIGRSRSLATLLLPIGLLGFLEYYRRGEVDLRIAMLLALGFSAILAVIAIRMWFER